MSAQPSPITGWQKWTGEALAALPALDAEARRAFFVGAWPRWSHAVDAEIPKRALVPQLAQALQAAAAEPRSTVSVLVGVPGEGKTLALMQVAAILAKEHGWTVHARPSPSVAVEATQVAQLEDGPHLLAFDHVERDLDQLMAVCRLLALAQKTDVHLLASAREADWNRAVRGWKKRNRRDALGEGLEVQVLHLGGVNPVDTGAAHQAWQGATASVGDMPEGAEAAPLLDTSLELHFDAESLAAHAARLLATVEGAAHEAVIIIAAAQTAGFGGAHPAVLADRLGIPLNVLWTDVLPPLGAAGLITLSDGNLVTRHPRLARPIVLAAHRAGVDLAAVYAGLVAQLVVTGRGRRIGSTYGRTLSGARKLAARLPEALDAEVRAQIAAAAEAEVPAKEGPAPQAARSEGEAGPTDGEEDEGTRRKRKRRKRRKGRGGLRSMLTYTVKPERVAENEAMIKAVHAQLAAIGDPDVHFATFTQEDGRTFVHLTRFAHRDKEAVLTECATWRAFSETLADRCEGAPRSSDLRAVELSNFE